MQMTVKLTTVAVLLAIAAPARADEWTKLDTSLELAGAALHLADWSQTLNISDRAVSRWTVSPATGYRYVAADCSEANIFLGPTPSRGAVSAYFAATLIGHSVIARLLPHPWRTVWQSVWIGVEAGAIANNVASGVRFALP